jgi:prolyl-tRNA synthetase
MKSLVMVATASRAGAGARRSSIERDEIRRRDGRWAFRPAHPAEIRGLVRRECGIAGAGRREEHADSGGPRAGRPAQHDRGREPDDYHLRTSRLERFQAEFWICGKWRRETCIGHAARLEIRKTMEIGHIFKLGYKYSESMGLHVTNAEGEEVTPIMGSYGIGIERILSAAIELYHDKDGMSLPPRSRRSP